MAIHRTKKQKETTHYPFLVSWTPKLGSEARVKGESKLAKTMPVPKLTRAERADLLAKDASLGRIKKDIIRSLILVSFILALEVVVYLAWSRFIVR